MSRSRDYISLKIKLAAALLQIPGKDGGRIIRHEDAKLLTADQIISCFHLDHYPIAHADGGPDLPWNLTFRPILDHREKTKRDVAAMAKVKRIADKLNRALRKLTPAHEKRKWPSRKIPSRQFRYWKP
jgi:hypothetical protein